MHGVAYLSQTEMRHKTGIKLDNMSGNKLKIFINTKVKQGIIQKI